MCGSLLSLLALLSAASPVFFFLFLPFILLVIGDLLSSDRRSSPFFSRHGVIADSNPTVCLGDGNGEDFLFPLVWRGWQFRGVSHRGAANRTNKTLEERQKAEGMGLRKLGWGKTRNVRPFCDKASRPPCITANGILTETISIKSLFHLLRI